MTGIANSVWVFNESYRRVWDALSADNKRPLGRDMAIRVRDNIEALMKAGRVDPEGIAAIILERMK